MKDHKLTETPRDIEIDLTALSVLEALGLDKYPRSDFDKFLKLNYLRLRGLEHSEKALEDWIKEFTEKKGDQDYTENGYDWSGHLLD